MQLQINLDRLYVIVLDDFLSSQQLYRHIVCLLQNLVDTLFDFDQEIAPFDVLLQ